MSDIYPDLMDLQLMMVTVEVKSETHNTQPSRHSLYIYSPPSK